MSNLLVTGGAGFIGGNFVHYWNEAQATLADQLYQDPQKLKGQFEGEALGTSLAVNCSEKPQCL